MGCRNRCKSSIAGTFSIIPLAPTVLTGGRVACEEEPLTFQGKVTLVPMTWAPRESNSTRLVLDTACTEYKLKPRPGMCGTSVNVVRLSVNPWNSMSMLPTHSTMRRHLISIVMATRPGRGGIISINAGFIVSHTA